MNSSIFVYPIVPLKFSATKNPYINDLIVSLENAGNTVVNKQDERHNGVFSIFHYFFKTNIFYFNWIEYLAKKKLGGFQLVVFLLQIFLIKIFNKKIIWTLHNLSSHYSNDWSYKFIQDIMIKSSNLIVIHTKESYDFLEKKDVDKSKIFYSFHPITQNPESISKCLDNKEKKYDILIWGLMSPYKGVYEFLLFLKNKGVNYKIMLAGKFNDITYFDKVNLVATDDVIINNSFISDEDLFILHAQSKYILFPYNSLSVLNSGALTLSLSCFSNIIGPNRGAFKELADLGIIYNFNTYDDILKLLNKDFESTDNNVKEFIENNTWDHFGLTINKMLQKI